MDKRGNEFTKAQGPTFVPHLLFLDIFSVFRAVDFLDVLVKDLKGETLWANLCDEIELVD
jgi:hypothetical protein